VKYLTDSCHIVQSNCCEAFYKHCVVLYCMCYLTEISCVLHGWKYIQKSHIRRGHDVYTSCLPVSSAAEDIERGRLRKLKQFQNYITFQLQSPIIFKPEVPALGLLYPPLSVRPFVRSFVRSSRPKSQFNYITIDFVIKHNQLT
jgi:hypothetical protein